jgi:defect in organelle trafficking protein DotD
MAIRSRVYCGLLLAGLLAGCASVTPVPTDVATTGMPNTEYALQQSLAKVRLAMAQLNGMDAAPPVSQPPIVPGELDRPINFLWSGPLDQGVEELASTVGYQVSVSGPKNPQPLVVSVNVSNATVLDAFRALGDAAGTAATVVVNPGQHAVEVQHHV